MKKGKEIRIDMFGVLPADCIWEMVVFDQVIYDQLSSTDPDFLEWI